MDIATQLQRMTLCDRSFFGRLFRLTSKPSYAPVSTVRRHSEGESPRPYGPDDHGAAPNDFLQSDYVDIVVASSGKKYVLILPDDPSNYCWFLTFPDTAAGNAARAIIDWSAAFGVPVGHMSDGQRHLKNETLGLISKGLRVLHHFTLPYTPWSDGGVNHLGKELLHLFRAFISELPLDHGGWPDLLPLVQSAIDNAPSLQRAIFPSVTAMTGIVTSPPISTF